MKAGNYLLLLVFALFVMLAPVFPQAPPPPPSMHGSSGNQPAGNGAPVGTGMALMAGLFASYGAIRSWNNRKKS